MSSKNDKEHATLTASLVKELPEIVEEAEYDELWGYQLTPDGQFYNAAIAENLVYKFLKANNWDTKLAKEQLTNTLKWRKQFEPLKAAFEEQHAEKFDHVVALTQYGDDVVTWNLYNLKGKFKPKDLFTDLDAFLRFRIGIMEKSLQKLEFDSDSKDYMIQVHDYEGVSFMRFDPDIKRGSRATIKLFQDNYPELLKKKFFVNVPTLMTWVYDFVKLWLNKQTTSKFVLLSNSGDLAKHISPQVPKSYGGKGLALAEQHISEVTPTAYTSFLLQQEFTNEMD